jgi:hypothetical protein
MSISVRTWNPEEDLQNAAQAQAIYETEITRYFGLSRKDFRDRNGVRIDVKNNYFPGINFQLVTGVQKKHSFVIPGTRTPTARAKERSMERFFADDYPLKRQNYEETLASVRKMFYRVTQEPEGFYVWPMAPGVKYPILYATQQEALLEAEYCSLHEDPRLTKIWWSPPTPAHVARNPLSGRRGTGPAGGYTKREREDLPASDFLKPKTRSWPVGDKRHAEIALNYMAWGRGNRSEYPQLLRRLFELYPPHKHPDLVDRAKKMGLVPQKQKDDTHMKFNPFMRRNPEPAAEITVARFPTKCAKCGEPFVPRQTEIVDSGERGPKGGKRMVHAHAEECG